jgi:hydroxymethylpyrimidine pyrophosphatase-like HAD family hydrolase
MEIPVEASYAFGDGLNDLEMMDTVGTSLVMGNAGNELKAKADYVLPSVDEDGVADGIYRYILKTI